MTTDAGDTEWRQLVIDIGERVAEAVASVMLEVGAIGVETVDEMTLSVPDRVPQPDDPAPGMARLTVTFPRRQGLEADVIAAVAHLAEALEEVKAAQVTWRDLAFKDWNKAFKDDWRAFEICPNVWVAPSWDPQTPEGTTTIRIDPGLAFGTGTHATTRLCARAIVERCENQAPASMLDVGCGTAVLAIAGLLHGVERAVGTEIDPVAVRVSIDNAADNGVGERFSASISAPDEHGTFPLVVANILAGPLIDLAPRIVAAVAPGGDLMLSGILKGQADDVRRAYEAEGLHYAHTEHDDGWVRIDLSRSR